MIVIGVVFMLLMLGMGMGGGMLGIRVGWGVMEVRGGWGMGEGGIRGGMVELNLLKSRDNLYKGNYKS